MEQVIRVDYPEMLAFSLKMGKTEFESEIKKLSIIKLYELGKISSGLASKILGVGRLEFLEILGKYEVSYLNGESVDEIESDMINAKNNL